MSNSEKNFLIYRFQPIERDANAHAGTEIKRIFERLEQTYGPIESCQRYSVMLTAEARFVAAKAREKYGDDFEVKIDEAMHKAYEIIHGVEAKKAYRISVQFEGRGWVEKVVSTAAAGKEELRQKLADEARRFALKEAMRLGMPPEGVNGAQTKIDTVPMERQQTKERSVERGRGVG